MLQTRLRVLYQLIVSYLLGWFFDGFSRFCNKDCWLWHGRVDAGSVKACIYLYYILRCLDQCPHNLAFARNWISS